MFNSIIVIAAALVVVAVIAFTFHSTHAESESKGSAKDSKSGEKKK